MLTPPDIFTNAEMSREAIKITQTNHKNWEKKME